MASIVDGTAQLGTLTLNLSQTGMTGAHNHLNAFVAIILTAQVTNLPIGQIAPILRHYSGLPYRCEQVYRDEQRIIINDSKSTNLESTMAALSIARRPAILLMGGQGKGEAYHDLATKKDQIEILITFGASGKDIKNQAPPETRSEHFEKMAAAVSRALDLSEKQGLDIIFSPGCASFDEFKNFEHRGAVFTQMVKDHLKLEASDGYLIRNES
jgi:UDP-N-acetylmuramoylalanine--D-glutamate ligase